MKKIPCSIDILEEYGEACWLVAVSMDNAMQAALQLSALHTGLISRITFQDSLHSKVLTLDKCSAVCGGHLVPLTEPWLEAVWHLFLKTALNGWTDTAHLDQAFLSANGNVTITLEITHP